MSSDDIFRFDARDAMSRRLLINASNLHNGGGVQVAASFLYELAGFGDFGCALTIYASTEVDANLKLMGADLSRFERYLVIDVFGLAALRKRVTSKFLDFDIVFTIFGPLYLSRRIPNHIIGFAQSWILHSDNEVSRMLGLRDRLILRLKFWTQWQFFRFAAERLVVELPHVKRCLTEYRRFRSDKIDVVENCFSPIYLDREKWEFPDHGFGGGREAIRLGYVSRGYPHKNLDILLPVLSVLRASSAKMFQIYVTLNDSEWARFPQEYRDAIRNVGPLSLAQCPGFYESMDGVIFTSLLECFSATPLEAMVMRKPLFASDRDFVRDVCGRHAIYVDPLNAVDIAEKVLDWFEQKPNEERLDHVESAYRHVMGLPTSKDRASGYMRIIRERLVCDQNGGA